MKTSKISRRWFVETTAIGAGLLTLTAPTRLFAGGSSFPASTLKKIWTQAKAYTLEFAEAMPDGKYEFKPTEEVYSYAEQLLHLAGANFWFFASIKGEAPPHPQETFKAEGKTREGVIKLLEESFTYGDGIMNGMTDESASEEVTMGKNTFIKWKIILFCVDHITHHRGQMVVYLRLNGIKPPQYRSGFYS